MPAIPSLHPAQESFVGRTKEFGQLADLLARAENGEGSTVILSGEAGIGKSALVRQLAGLAPVITGYCHALAATPPYGPWLDLLTNARMRSDSSEIRALLDRLGGAADGLSRHDFLIGMVDALSAVATPGPLIVVLEDMHWADEQSLELVLGLSRQIPQLPLVLILTCRDDELEDANLFHNVMPELIRATRVARMPLTQFSSDEIATLVGTRYALPDSEHAHLLSYLESRTGGNPFFLTELLYLLEDERVLDSSGNEWNLKLEERSAPGHDVPDLVRRVLEARVEHLGDLTRSILKVAAVFGQDIPLRLWRAVCGVSEVEFDHAVGAASRARIIQESAGGMAYSFSHAMVRDTIYRSVSPAERQRLHLRAAEELLQASIPDTEVVAYHLAGAVDPRAVDWLTRAASRAMAVHAPQAAVVHCDRALDLAGSLGVAVPVETLRTRGRAQSMLGRFAPALGDFSTSLDLAVYRADGVQQWETLIALGMLWNERDYTRTGEYYNRALELAREIDDPGMVAHSLNRVGNWHLNNDQPAQAIVVHSEALDMFRNAGDLHGEAQTTDLLGMDHILAGSLDVAEQYLARASEFFTALDDQFGLCSSLASYVFTSGADGLVHDLPARSPALDVEATIEKAIALARSIPWHAGEAYASCVAGGFYAIRGRFDAGIPLLERAAEIAERIEHHEWGSYAAYMLGNTYHALCNLDRAQEYMTRSAELARRVGSRVHLRCAIYQSAMIDVAAGETDRALEKIDSIHDWRNESNSSNDRACLLVRGMALLEAGDGPGALDLGRRVAGEGQPIAPIWSLLIGSALVSMKRYRQAERELLAGLDCATSLGYQPHRWRISTKLADLYTVWGSSADFNRYRAEAIATVEALATTVQDPDVRERFLTSALGQVPSRRKRSPVQAAREASGGLTLRQREVAMLIAAGETNGAIATALNISERTVESHVSAIMNALDLNSRSQIAAWTVARGLVTP